MTVHASSPADFDHATHKLTALRSSIESTMIGQTEVIDELLMCVVAGGHALIEGVPGLGKTLLIRCLASSVQAAYARIQFTPDLMPSDIVGHTIFDADTQAFSIRRGPVFTHFVLADEINRAPAKTQSALLEAMQEQQVSIEGETLPLASPFMVMATQNPIEQEGTYPLPQAQLDRFLLKVLIRFPAEDEELQILEQTTRDRVGDQLDTSAVTPVMDTDDLIKLQATAARVQVDREVARYIVRIVQATRDWNGIESGAGPRGGIALLRAARASALASGSDFVVPDDIKAVACAALRHRIRLTADLEIEGYDPDDVIVNLLEQTPVPRQ